MRKLFGGLRIGRVQAAKNVYFAGRVEELFIQVEESRTARRLETAELTPR